MDMFGYKFKQAGVVGICLLMGYLFYDSVRPWMLDDAFISFRYAEHWVNGQGLVYNPGEYVEGFTSFLWVALLAAAYRLGMDTVNVSIALGVVCSVAVMFILLFSYRFVHLIRQSESALAALLLGTCGVFVPWSFSGMETALFTLILTMTLLYVVGTARPGGKAHASFLLGCGCGIALLCRPEGMLLTAVLAVDQCIGVRLFSRRHPERFKPFLIFLTPILLTQACYLGFRYAYYSEWLPNTYYVKVGHSMEQYLRGWGYVVEFCKCAGLLCLIAIAGWIKTFICDKRIPLRDGGLILPAIVLLFLFYCVYVGGDSMPAFRFMAPVLPVLCVTAALSVRALSGNRMVYMILAGALLVWNVYQMQWNWHIYGHIVSDRVAQDGKELGLWMKANLPQDAKIATNTAGSVGYYSGLYTIDMLGLTDKHIARRKVDDMGRGSAGHEKGDGAYILSVQPDVIQLGSGAGAVEPMFRSGQELFAIEAFHQQYELKVFALPNGKDGVLYQKKK